MRRCSTPSSRRLEMLMRRRGKSPGSCGCPAPISACSAWIRSSWRRLTLSRFRSPGRSAHKVDCWANGAVTLRLWSTFEHGHMITTWRSMSPTEVTEHAMSHVQVLIDGKPTASNCCCWMADTSHRETAVLVALLPPHQCKDKRTKAITSPFVR